MESWYIISKTTENDNTAEFGYGDFPKTTYYVSLVVEAETKRKAQNLAKKISPNRRYMFNGINRNEVYSSAEMAEMTHIDLNRMLQKLQAEASIASQDYANKYLAYVNASHDKIEAWERTDATSKALESFKNLNK